MEEKQVGWVQELNTLSSVKENVQKVADTMWIFNEREDYGRPFWRIAKQEIKNKQIKIIFDKPVNIREMLIEFGGIYQMQSHDYSYKLLDKTLLITLLNLVNYVEPNDRLYISIKTF